MIKLAISGCCGRMGKRIDALARLDGEVEVVGLLESSKCPGIGSKREDVEIFSDVFAVLKDADCLIDFTVPAAAIESLRASAEMKKGVVIGTTGFSEEELSQIKEFSACIPVLLSPNMSVGVNLLFDVVSDVAKRLGDDYDVEIVEAHHHFKKDAPSGTAKKFAEVLREVRKKDIPAHSLRIGDVVGDHTVVFAGPQERIEITHRAHSRDVFALGAIRAAKWLVGKGAGLYGMKDVLR